MTDRAADRAASPDDGTANRERDSGRMAEIVDRAKSVDGAQLASAANKHQEDVEAEAARTRRAADAMSGGDVPRGKDDPQHLTGNTQQTPLPDQTGGRGRSPEDDR